MDIGARAYYGSNKSCDRTRRRPTRRKKTNKPTWLQMSKEKIGCTLMHFTYIPPHHETHTDDGAASKSGLLRTTQMIWGPPSLSFSMCGVFLFVCKWRFDWGKKKSLGRDDSIVYVCIYTGRPILFLILLPIPVFPSFTCPNWRWSLHHFFLAYPATRHPRRCPTFCNPSNTPANVCGMALIKTKNWNQITSSRAARAISFPPPAKIPRRFFIFFLL